MLTLLEKIATFSVYMVVARLGMYYFCDRHQSIYGKLSAEEETRMPQARERHQGNHDPDNGPYVNILNVSNIYFLP